MRAKEGLSNALWDAGVLVRDPLVEQVRHRIHEVGCRLASLDRKRLGNPILNDMVDLQRRTHRTYTPQFKAELVAMCQKPGISIAAVAQQHGMNANLLHRWRKEWAQGLHRPEVGVTTAVQTPQTPAFIPIELNAAASTTASEQPPVASSLPAADIRIECQRPGVSVTVHWPLSGAYECAQMLGALLR